MGCVNTRRWKQDSCLLDMGGFMTSEWVITLVFFLYSKFARHFTRLRHTLKGVNLCCFSSLCIADIGWIFSRMLHCFGLFFYSGQFKSCFPHHRTLDFSRVLLLFGGLPPQPHPNGPDIGVGLYAMGHGWVKFSIIVHRFTTRR